MGPSSDRIVDCCVVGAGYAGLTAALRLHRAGASVVVLEGRHRVGGRVFTHVAPDGTRIDLGGTWIGAGQERVYALAEELGVSTYPTFETGDKLYVIDGEPRRYRASIAEVAPAAAGLGAAMRRLDALAAELPADAPWDAPHALEWDGITTAAWIAAEVPDAGAREQLERWLIMLFTADLAEVSLLHTLFLIRSAGSLRVLLAIEGGYQQDHLEGGAQEPANRMAGELGAALRLGAMVRDVAQDDGGVTVSGVVAAGNGAQAGGAPFTVRAAQAIVAIPLALAAGLRFSPSLPADRAQLQQRAPSGSVAKAVAVYETPFWREDGLSGESIDPGHLLSLTMDTSPHDGSRGVITAFAYGPDARTFARLDSTARRKLALSGFAERFGPQAAEPYDYVEQDWVAEELSRGGYMSHFGCGVLTTYGRALTEPCGRVHWAGSETATTSHGAIDGAIRSGERAAVEVLGDDSPRGLASLGAIAQGAILPGKETR
jgi:monoamine oxidase